MKMVEVKTAELIGPALNWAVAMAAGLAVEIKPHGQYSNASTGHKLKGRSYRLWMVSDVEPEECTPSTDWSQGGPLIEKHGVSLHCPQSTDDVWAAWIITDQEEVATGGSSALIAACRAIVAAKLGDVVSVPAELINEGGL